MKKIEKYLFLLAFLILSGLVSANSSSPTYYYYQGQKIDLPVDFSRLALKFHTGLTTADPVSVVSNTGVQIISAEPTGINQRYLVTLKTPLSTVAEVDKNIKTLLNSPSIDFASPVFQGIVSGTWVTITPDILLRFKPEFVSNSELLLSILAPELEIITKNFGNMSGAYILRSSSRNGFEVLAIANRLTEDPRVAWSEPDAHFSAKADLTPNDTYFSLLWGILNNWPGGTADMDLDGDSAWDYTTGDSTIKIMVFETGVQQDHPDINQVPGFDFTSEGIENGGPGNECDNHGTGVAGCISAIINNNLGTIGVAPDCKTVSARVGVSTVPCNGTWNGQFSWSVNALAWAETTGVRVTNNSNSYGATFNALTAKYDTTHTNGMVHFASAGNASSSNIAYPAEIPIVNAVAALDTAGLLADFSNWGVGLDFSAPGVLVVSTDRTGDDGYVAGDYLYFGGTSAASPYSAGVAALVLSQNPSLTSNEVESIMRCSCKDLGPLGYETTYGWGFVNAENALLNTPESDLDSDGLSNQCDNCAAVSNPTQEDTDADNVGDSCDNCLSVANSNQADSDTDQVGNVCDICPNHYNPLQQPIKAGDANASGGNPNLTDIIYVVNYVFNSGLAPNPICRGDANASGGNPGLADIIYLVNYIFNSGPGPVKIGVCCL